MAKCPACGYEAKERELREIAQFARDVHDYLWEMEKTRIDKEKTEHSDIPLGKAYAVRFYLERKLEDP